MHETTPSWASGLTSFLYSLGIPDDKPLSSALLTRARILSDEHVALTKRQAETFDSKTAKRIGELAPAANALQSWEKAQEVSHGHIIML